MKKLWRIIKMKYRNNLQNVNKLNVNFVTEL